MIPKLALANPWVLGAIGAALVASHATVGFKAYRAGQDRVIAETAKIIDSEVRTRDAAIAAASAAISQIEVRNVTIRQKAETVTREIPVYRDCVHDPDGLRLVNRALEDVPEPADSGKLPSPDAPR